MIRLSEEQRGILSCYSGTKDKVAEELARAIPFIEDMELRELSEELLILMGKFDNEAFERVRSNDKY